MKFVKLIKASNEIWDKNYLEQNFKNKWGNTDDYYLVNMEEDGDYLYGVRIWPGSGYQTNGFLVRCESDDIDEILEKVSDFMLENNIKGAFTHESMKEWLKEELESKGIEPTKEAIQDYMNNDEDFNEQYTWTGSAWLLNENMKIKEMKHK